MDFMHFLDKHLHSSAAPRASPLVEGPETADPNVETRGKAWDRDGIGGWEDCQFPREVSGSGEIIVRLWLTIWGFTKWSPHDKRKLSAGTKTADPHVGASDVPSGEHTNNHGKSLSWMGKSTISMAMASIAMLNGTRTQSGEIRWDSQETRHFRAIFPSITRRCPGSSKGVRPALLGLWVGTHRTPADFGKRWKWSRGT